MYLFRLIYYSTNAVQAGEASLQEELKSILLHSQKNNPPLGVSGALMFNYNFFAQVLEGDRKAVTHTFCRIANDPRHSDIVILDASPISERMFEEWSMGFVGGTVGENQLRRYGSSTQFNPAKMTADSLLAFIHDVVGTTGTTLQSAKAS